MKIAFNDEQKRLLKKILPQVNVETEISEDDYFLIDETVADYLTLHCFDEDYEPNREGIVCEDILDILADVSFDA